MVHCAGLEGLRAFLSSLVIPEMTPNASKPKTKPTPKPWSKHYNFPTVTLTLSRPVNL